MSGVGGNAQVTDRTKKFVAMPSVEAGMMFKADYIERYNGNFARWFSKDTDKQEVYKKTISAIRPKIVEAIAAATKTH